MLTGVGAILVLFAFFLSSYHQSEASLGSNQVLGISTLPAPKLNPIKTQSLFKSKISQKIELIPKDTVYKDDPETEAGNDTVLDEGENGKKTTTIKITYVRDPESPDLIEDGVSYRQYDQEVTDINTIDPKNKIISRGTKIVWRNLDTPDGTITYWKKLHVWATHYDSHCPGCDEWTATGLRQGKGVIAVDPRVIKLGSKVYVPGYGLAIAGDTGGAIKGNTVDLGFPDARTAGWSARFTDIYILN